jgi:acetyl esterase
MDESGRVMTLPTAASQSVLRRPVQLLEHAMLDTARRVFGAVELSEPVTRWLFKQRVRVLRNVPYLGTGHPAHLLDVYRPLDVVEGELRPIVFYVHGGGFAVCSKDTHWVMAQSYARQGYVVVNVNYRLAPSHPFPRGLSDVCAAYLWLLDNAERFGGDVRRIVLAGESAGANLVSSLALISAMQRPEPWAQAVFRRAVAPRAVVAACGLFEVSNTQRFHQLARESWGITRLAIEHVGRSYLPGNARWDGEHDLANPLHILERKHTLHRPLPSFFVPCGGADPIVDDSRRLAQALDAAGVHHEARYYDGEIHAFHALWWREQARRCWVDTHDFLSRALATTRANESEAA